MNQPAKSTRILAWCLYVCWCGLAAPLVVDVPCILIAGRPAPVASVVLVWIAQVALGAVRREQRRKTDA